MVRQKVNQLYMSHCLKCDGPGPNDVHTSYPAISAIIITSCTSHPEISCRFCASKKQLTSTILSLILGWWGFPFGILLTPVQMTRNIAGIFRRPSPLMPSDKLTHMVRLNLAAEAAEQGKLNASQASCLQAVFKGRRP